MLDYAPLAALASVVREGSFERAARALHGTASAVSQRIRLLEERVGRALIVRGQTIDLVKGWNLIATGDQPSPAQLNAALTNTASTLPASGQVYNNLTSLWAWDAGQSPWYFWAPNLVNNGGLAAYLGNKGYLDFATLAGTPTGTLSPSTGVWVNLP